MADAADTIIARPACDADAPPFKLSLVNYL
jgi:hypothetical protein